MQLNLTLNLTLNLRWHLDVNEGFEKGGLSRCPGILSTVLRALFRDDQGVMQPTTIALPSLPSSLLSLLF